MSEYHKIDSMFKRDPRGRIIKWEYSRPEFEYLADCEWVWTEKVDGTNIRLHYSHEWSTSDNAHKWIFGRTDAAQIPPHLLDRLISLYRSMPWTEVFPSSGDVEHDSDVILYGEGYGAKIQKGGGKYLPDSCDFVLFDVRVGSWWLTRDAVEDVAAKLGLDVVPILGTGTLAEAVEMTRHGFPSQRWPGVDVAEGLVLRPTVELFDRGGRRVITKIKARDFQ